MDNVKVIEKVKNCIDKMEMEIDKDVPFQVIFRENIVLPDGSRKNMLLVGFMVKSTSPKLYFAYVDPESYNIICFGTPTGFFDSECE